MRTTLTIEPDVAMELQRLQREQNSSLKALVNEVLRLGLRTLSSRKRKPTAYSMKPLKTGFRSGVDLLHLNSLAGDLDVEDATGKLGRK